MTPISDIGPEGPLCPFFLRGMRCHTGSKPALRSLTSFHQQPIHCHAELLLARACDDAIDRRDVGKIPPYGEDDVIVLDQKIIGRVEADPADLLAAPQRDPCVGRVRALQARLARWRDGAQIAADIGRRQSKPAQPGGYHMSKILAHAMAVFAYLVERR